MAVRVARFTTWQPESIILHDEVEYPCRQISAAGLDLLQRMNETAKGDDTAEVTRAELVAEVAALLSAPVEVVKRCSVDELISVLISASVPADALRDAITEDAEKNGDSGAAVPTPPKRRRK
jgi:hypothetical protein